MKIIFAALLLLASRCIAAPYWFGRLVDESAKHVAPLAMQQTMARIEKKRLQECVEEHHFSGRTVASYFAAIPIDLGENTKVTYLVFPSRYCTAFFGAHAISYWLLEKKPDGSYALLFSGSSDGIEVLTARWHGLYEFNSFYGHSAGRLRFDGEVYQGEDP